MQAVWNKKVFKIRGEPYFMKLRAFTSNNVSEQSTATKAQKSMKHKNSRKAAKTQKLRKHPAVF